MAPPVIWDNGRRAAASFVDDNPFSRSMIDPHMELPLTGVVRRIVELGGDMIAFLTNRLRGSTLKHAVEAAEQCAEAALGDQRYGAKYFHTNVQVMNHWAWLRTRAGVCFHPLHAAKPDENRHDSATASAEAVQQFEDVMKTFDRRYVYSYLL